MTIESISSFLSQVSSSFRLKLRESGYKIFKFHVSFSILSSGFYLFRNQFEVSYSNLLHVLLEHTAESVICTSTTWPPMYAIKIQSTFSINDLLSHIIEDSTMFMSCMFYLQNIDPQAFFRYPVKDPFSYNFYNMQLMKKY